MLRVSAFSMFSRETRIKQAMELFGYSREDAVEYIELSDRVFDKAMELHAPKFDKYADKYGRVKCGVDFKHPLWDELAKDTVAARHFVMEAHYGSRCKEYEPGCTCCEAWRLWDAYKEFRIPISCEVSRECAKHNG